ncbi:MAG TPA: hypothetical protein VMT70_23305 [Vicinamibacteria bacterium]|nr:hypothetical protein [Vicinamibacteria bacterium]
MRWLALTFALGLLAAAESADVEAGSVPGPRLVARTSRALYYSVDHARVDVRRSEDYLARLETLFGRPSEGWHVEIVVHPATAPLRTEAGVAALGITDLAARRIDSVQAFHPHELVHAAAGRNGVAPAFFAEGLAVALSSGGRWNGRDVDAVARGAAAAGVRIEPLLDQFGDVDPALEYCLAGSFVAFLLETEGIEPMVAFLRGCGSSPARFERAFRAAYGCTFAAATLAWRARLLAGRGSTWRWADESTWPRSLEKTRSTRAQAVATEVERPRAETGVFLLLSPEGGGRETR